MLRTGKLQAPCPPTQLFFDSQRDEPCCCAGSSSAGLFHLFTSLATTQQAEDGKQGRRAWPSLRHLIPHSLKGESSSISHLVRCKGGEYLRDPIKAGPARGSRAHAEVPWAPALGVPTTSPCYIACNGRLTHQALLGLPPHGTSREQRRCCVCLTPRGEEMCCPEPWLFTGRETT